MTALPIPILYREEQIVAADQRSCKVNFHGTANRNQRLRWNRKAGERCRLRVNFNIETCIQVQNRASTVS